MYPARKYKRREQKWEGNLREILEPGPEWVQESRIASIRNMHNCHPSIINRQQVFSGGDLV